MQLSNLEEVTALEKRLKRIKYIRKLMDSGLRPYVGAKNEHAEDQNYPIPFEVADEVLDVQERIVVDRLAELGVSLDE